MTEKLRNEEDLTGVTRLVRLEIANARRALDGMGEDALLAVHEARKSIKRARSIARLLRESDREVASLVNAAARRAGHVLAEARDADSLEQLARAMVRDCDDDAARPALSELAAQARADRERVDRETAARQAARALDEMDRALAGLPTPDDAPDVVARGMARTYRRAAKRLGKAQSVPDGERLHELRKRTQDWRYQAIALKRAWPDEVERRKSQTDELDDLLGLHHDLSRLARRLDDLADADAAIERVEARCEALAAQALERAEAVFGDRPKKVKKALKAGFRDAG